jgi:hypothetical protein
MVPWMAAWFTVSTTSSPDEKVRIIKSMAPGAVHVKVGHCGLQLLLLQGSLDSRAVQSSLHFLPCDCFGMLVVLDFFLFIAVIFFLFFFCAG